MHIIFTRNGIPAAITQILRCRPPVIIVPLYVIQIRRAIVPFERYIIEPSCIVLLTAISLEFYGNKERSIEQIRARNHDVGVHLSR